MGTSSTHDGSVATPRRPIRVVPALRQAGGTLLRLVGSTDVRGHGTAFSIVEVGPFVLVGVARGLRGPGLPAFGDHPHAGLLALSYVPEGARWRSRSNLPGLEHLPFGSGEVLMTFAGRGIVHDEPTAGEGSHSLWQCILRLPPASRDAVATIRRWQPTAIAPGVVRLFGSVQLSAAGLDAAGYHVRVPAGRSVRLKLAAAHAHGFAFARTAPVRVSGVPLSRHDVAVLGAEGDELELSAVDGRDAECFVAVAAPVAGPWVKLLGHNGFVIAEDEACAAAKLAHYARDPAHFGR